MCAPCRRVYDKLRWFWHEKLHFLVFHYLYMGTLIFVLSGFWYCQGDRVDYIDALFMVASSATNTGLNTVDVAEISTYQLILTMFASILGSHIVISVFIVLVRKYYFSKRFEAILLFNRAQRLKEQTKRRLSRDERERSKSMGDVLQRTRTLPPRLRSNRTSLSLFDLTTSATRHRSGSTAQDEQRAAKQRKDIYDQVNRMHTEPVAESDNTRNAPVSRPSPPPQPPLAATTAATSTGSTTTATSTGEHSQRQPNEVTFDVEVDHQREYARQQLQKYDKLLNWITKHGSPRAPDQVELATDAEEEEEEIQEIMSRPIHKSQLTRRQRYHIGGAEYRAIDFLTKAVPVFYVFTLALFSFAMRIYVACSTYAQGVLETSNPQPVGPWMFSFYSTISAFNNLGLAPLSASLVPFQNAPAPLIFLSLLIMLGNTAYAITLRAIIWCLHKLIPRERYAMASETLRFLLDHPRRCYTTMFSSTQTWWLLFVLVVMNVIEIIVFLSTNFWLPVLEGIPWGSRILDAYFQGVATRNAGFSVVNVGMLNPGTQVVYIVAMYISVYPVAISIRNSNIYQERELGIYSNRNAEDDGAGGEPLLPTMTTGTRLRQFPTLSSVVTSSRRLLPRASSFYVRIQVQRQLAREICWVIVGIFCISVIESKEIMAQTPITVLSVMYECVSAFATAGSSLGYPGANTSQSAKYHTLSKLVIIALMYRGRHRGLPSAIDHAVLLPSEQLEQKEEKEHQLKQRHAEISDTFGSSTGVATPYWRHRSLSPSCYTTM